jgi:hypothetical protein
VDGLAEVFRLSIADGGFQLTCIASHCAISVRYENAREELLCGEECVAAGRCLCSLCGCCSNCVTACHGCPADLAKSANCQLSSILDINM